MKKALLGIILMLVATVATGQPSDSNDDLPLLNPDVPEQYQVVPGDTLWDISALFLRDPWMWPEIWHANQQIANPHLIYPGDIISLVYMDGRPQLMLSRNREEKLSPHIRVEAHQSPIPALPLEAIDNFLSKTRVVSDNQLNLAPYVLGGYERRLLVGVGDDFYARGDFSDQSLNYGVYRRGTPYLDPVSGELLGIRAQSVGRAQVKTVKRDIATLGTTYAEGEIRAKDRLLAHRGKLLPSVFHPRAPNTKVEAVVISVEGGVRNAGALDVVAVNRGDRDGLQAGDTLALYKAGELVKDQVAKNHIRLPDEQIGLLMVFRTYQKMSFGLVLVADRQLDLGDLARNP
jgi:hypothetical protein